MNNFWKNLLIWVVIAIAFMFVASVGLMAIGTVLGLVGVTNQFTPMIVISFSGFVMSLLFSYWPVINVKFAALPASVKSLTNIISIIVISGLMYGFVCLGLIAIPGLVCTKAGFLMWLSTTAVALVINQTTDHASPDTLSVKALKTGTTPPPVPTAEDSTTTVPTA